MQGIGRGLKNPIITYAPLDLTRFTPRLRGTEPPLIDDWEDQTTMPFIDFNYGVPNTDLYVESIRDVPVWINHHKRKKHGNRKRRLAQKKARKRNRK